MTGVFVCCWLAFGALSASAESRVIEDVREAALAYSAHLPDFLCTQVTRRSLDEKGNGSWRDLDEVSERVGFYDGREHYQRLSSHKLAADSGQYPASMNSAGEFGSLVQGIFARETAARFSPAGEDRVRGRAVQVFAYEVDFAHKKCPIP